ncbi:cell surface protein [Weissella oryzae SG25]|uniref:Cell surface protein n=1 Tax=Weissella oryzae (strain DSM 25784 / JCM 18191 / LMG 30913 / SG25) TaxID=1329250 RepID=A0A069D1J9_WEIOS|nr:DUF916 and DUF3324 domain-containing protein [Weissella oryzae]GAK31226.1 cell surface protein [Weissella oryzae SG25]
MLQKILKSVIFISCITIVTAFSFIIGSANELSFSVEPTLPNNQINTKDGFFNLLLKPGQEEELHLKYSNNTDKPITVTTKVASASTNANGAVDYGDLTAKADKSLKYALPDLVTIPTDVKLKAHESKDVIFKVKMPDEKFDGIIAGGLTFNDQAADNATQEGTSKTAIKNIYGFQLALLMRQNEDLSNSFPVAKVAKDGLKLKSVKASQVNYRNVIDANLQNPLPVYINQFGVIAKVYSADGKKLLYQSKRSTMQMAPNTNFNYSINLDSGERLKPGKYLLKLTAFAEKNGQANYETRAFDDKKAEKYQYRWQFEREFTIKGSVAESLNRKDVTIKSTDWTSILVGVVCLLALIFGVGWFLIKKRQK